MIAEHDPILTASPDCAAKLLSDDVLADVAIVAEEEGVPENILEIGRGAMAQRGTTKIGAAIVLQAPYEVPQNPDLPGAASLLLVAARVMERPLYNRNPDIGTLLTWSRIGRRVKQLLHKFSPHPDLRFVFHSMQPVVEQLEAEGEVQKNYVFAALTAVPEILRPARPTIAVAGSTVTLACISPAAAVWFTVDGSWPFPANPSATLYIAPFPVAAGTVLRAAAFQAGEQASDAATALF